jgi:hypothetical protein
MKTCRRGLLVLLTSAAVLLGAEPKDCLRLDARIDNDVSSPSGIRVTITGRNNCSEDLDGHDAAFKVQAMGMSGSAIATQNGRFGGTIPTGGQVETKVFVACDPDRVRSVRVEHR